MSELVILVNDADQKIGSAEKIKAHEKALLHRAFSVFILRQTDNVVECLLQQRHPNKYHCGGLWTNTCCGHPRPGEKTQAAAERRLFEEMGITASLKEIGSFHYTAVFSNGLTENEIDHVFVGFHEKAFVLNPTEAIDARWVSLTDLTENIQTSPEEYTPWLMPALHLLLTTGVRST